MYTSRIIAACMNYINNEMSHRDYMWMDRYLTWSDRTIEWSDILHLPITS